LFGNQLRQLVDALRISKGGEMTAERSSHAEIPLAAHLRWRDHDAPIPRPLRVLAHLLNLPFDLVRDTHVRHAFDDNFEIHSRP